MRLKSSKHYSSLLIVMLLFSLACLAIFFSIWWVNDGHFLYTIDDPYIHLSLAKQIAKGNYGINDLEISSPATSILWPFLLTPWYHFNFFEYTPLIYNYCIALGSIWMIKLILDRVLNGLYKRSFVYVSLLIGLILAFNLIGLVFVGMEHSLQILFTLVIAYQLIRYLQEGKVQWILYWAVALAPTIRYEMLSISLMVILFLFIFVNKWKSTFTLIAMIALLASFSLYLHTMGLELLPSSVIIKSEEFNNISLLELIKLKIYAIFDFSFLDSFRKTFKYLMKLPAALIAFSGLGIALFSHKSAEERFLAGSCFLIILAHFAFSSWGWFNRYEVYLFAFAIPLLLFILRENIVTFFNNRPKWLCSAIMAAFLLFFSKYVFSLLFIPAAANNIYLQQYQMSRFVNEFYPLPVGVNDIGVVSLHNDSYVLDLYGLASEKARKARQKQQLNWMDLLAQNHNVKLIIIYDSFFSEQIPKNWIKVAQLTMTTRQVTVGDVKVSFYVTDKNEILPLENKLRAFRAGLPAGAKLSLLK